MRKSNCGTQLTQIYRIFRIIHCILIRFVYRILLSGMFFHISNSFLIHWKNTILATGFYGHIGNGKPIVHGKMGNAVACKFHGLIERAIHAYHADNMKYHIFSTHPFSRLSRQLESYRRRSLDPCLPRSHASRHIRASHTGRKSAQCTICTCMRIRTDDDVSRHRQPFFRQERMLDTHFTYFEIIGNLISIGKFPHTFAVLRRLDILVRHEMVRYKSNLIFIKYALCIHLLHFFDGHRTCNIVAQYKIQIRFDQLSCLYPVKPCMGSQNLLCHCHSHGFYPPVIIVRSKQRDKRSHHATCLLVPFGKLKLLFPGRPKGASRSRASPYARSYLSVSLQVRIRQNTHSHTAHCFRVYLTIWRFLFKIPFIYVYYNFLS